MYAPFTENLSVYRRPVGELQFGGVLDGLDITHKTRGLFRSLFSLKVSKVYFCAPSVVLCLYSPSFAEHAFAVQVILQGYGHLCNHPHWLVGCVLVRY